HASLTDAASLTERHRDKAVIADLLERLFNETPFIAEWVDSELKAIANNPDRLDAFLEQQNYRLAYWQTAKEELVYRRFFDVNNLVGFLVEVPQVFVHTPALIFN